MEGYTEDALLPISGLQHLAFCERQCALIHLEQIWEENALTVLGRHLHDKAHGGASESRRNLQVARGLRIRSLRLGLSGITDVVEFHRDASKGCVLPGRPGLWRPFPVEYKRGSPKKQNWDRVQLCAQALCLEEMLDTQITEGALFYGETRKREDVLLEHGLRREVEELAKRLHKLIDSGVTPPPPTGARCRSCSLRGPCAADFVGPKKSARHWLDQQLDEIIEGAE